MDKGLQSTASEMTVDKGLQSTASEMTVDKGLQSMSFFIGGDGGSVTHVFARRYLCVRSMHGKGLERGQVE